MAPDCLHICMYVCRLSTPAASGVRVDVGSRLGKTNAVVYRASGWRGSDRQVWNFHLIESLGNTDAKHDMGIHLETSSRGVTFNCLSHPSVRGVTCGGWPFKTTGDPPWSLHASATTPRRLLFSVASATDKSGRGRKISSATVSFVDAARHDKKKKSTVKDNNKQDGDRTSRRANEAGCGSVAVTSHEVGGFKRCAVHHRYSIQIVWPSLPRLFFGW